MAKQSTYAIRDGGWIKIGKAGNVQSRLATLQTSTAHRLELLAVAPRDIEQLTHRQLELANVWRNVGEWFEDTQVTRGILWRLGFEPVGAVERDQLADAIYKAYRDGRDVGFQNGIKHAVEAFSVELVGLHPEEHW